MFANGSFTAPGGQPTALVRRNIASGSMTNEDLDGGFLHAVRSREDIDRIWSTRIKRQQPGLDVGRSARGSSPKAIAAVQICDGNDSSVPVRFRPS
jgi:hypothetical protein